MSSGAYLHHIEITTADPEALAHFYADAMDMPALRQIGDTWLCEGRQRLMLFSPGAGKTLGYCAFACRDQAGVLAIRAQAEANGVAAAPSPSPLFASDAFAVTDPDGNVVVFGTAAERPVLRGLRGALQHLTLATLDPDAIEAFYVGKLGFLTSDTVRDESGRLLTCWMRSNHEHHTMACFRHTRQGIDHHSYEAGDWSVIKDWCDRMGDRRIRIIWGPGRHGPGNNLFIFIADPDGNWIEVSAELETVYDRKPVVWPHEEHTLNSWGAAIMRV